MVHHVINNTCEVSRSRIVMLCGFTSLKPSVLNGTSIKQISDWIDVLIFHTQVVRMVKSPSTKHGNYGSAVL